MNSGLYHAVMRRVPKKLLPKGKKSKSPRNVICKVGNPPDNNMVYIVYVKLTNILPIKCSGRYGLPKEDFAGLFTHERDAKHVADCLNKIFSLYHIYDDKYRLTHEYYVIPLSHYLDNNEGLQRSLMLC